MGTLNNKNFLIIAGLPRSGTAWLATALNLHPEIFAFHEGWVSDEPYLQRMQSGLEAGAKVVVDVTTCLLAGFNDVDASRIFLERPYVDCVGSAERVVPGWAANMAEAAQLADYWRDWHKPLSISYADLFGEKRDTVIRMILISMGLGDKICRLKLDQLGTMNVQLHGLNDGYYTGRKIQTTL